MAVFVKKRTNKKPNHFTIIIGELPTFAG